MYTSVGISTIEARHKKKKKSTMAESPLFVDARTELTPETEGDNGTPAPHAAIAAKRTAFPHQLFTEIDVQRVEENDNNHNDDDVSTVSAVMLQPL